MSALIKSVQSTIQKYAMLKGDAVVLVGLSGGPDSVCLITALRELYPKLKIHGAYIDHGLRPDETGAEAELCETLCKKLDAGFFKRPIDPKALAKKEGLNLQEAARKLRYYELDYIALACGATHLALGHNQDDQCETFFMRIMRGSGPKGLASIPPVRNNIIRPLIETPRHEIEQYLKEKEQGFATDSSNLKEDYLRNKMRSSLMPLITEMNPSIMDTVTRTCDILNEEERYFFITVTKKLMTLITKKTPTFIEMFSAPFETLDRAIARRVIRRALDETHGLRAIRLEHVEDLLALAMRGKAGDSLDLPGGFSAYKKYSTFVITSDEPIKLSDYTLEADTTIELNETNRMLRTSYIDSEEAQRIMDSPNKHRAVLDADKVTLPFAVRHRKAGDSFHPLGMQGKHKKMQDFMVDVKIPRFERDSVPIVVTGSDIAWVAGFRTDERFKATETTEKFMLIELL